MCRRRVHSHHFERAALALGECGRKRQGGLAETGAVQGDEKMTHRELRVKVVSTVGVRA